MNYAIGFFLGMLVTFIATFFAIRELTKFHKKTIKELVKEKKKLEDWIEAENWKPDVKVPDKDKGSILQFLNDEEVEKK